MTEPAGGASEARTSGTAWQKLADLLAARRGEHHIIVLQDYPDPDAISSALAHQMASKSYDIKADIIHEGRVSHQENLALVRLLEVDLIRYHPEFDLSRYGGAIFVDNQGTTAREVVKGLQEASVPILAVVDHHEPQNALQPTFSDIRSIGATASIYARYLQAGLLPLDAANDEHIRIATALMHGIMTDTQGFIRASETDFLAAGYLSEFRDVGLLAQIMSQARSKQTMAVIQRALQDRTLVESYSIVGVGYLRSEDRDAIPQAADFLLTEENVYTSIVFGIVREEDGEKMVGSMRTSKLTLDPDGFLKEVFGRSTDGTFFGGGKRSAGAFEIPIEFLAGEADDAYEELKWQVYEAQVRHRLFDHLGVEQEGGEEVD